MFVCVCVCGVLCLFYFLLCVCVGVCVRACVLRRDIERNKKIVFFSSANLNRKKLLYYVFMVIEEHSDREQFHHDCGLWLWIMAVHGKRKGLLPH